MDVIVRRNLWGSWPEAWQAVQAVNKLTVGWALGEPLPPHGDLHARLRAQTPTRDTRVVDSGDVDATLAAAPTVVRATYLYPYQMHGSVGTACAVADVQGQKATIWAASQAVWPLRSSTALLLGLQPENVHVIFTQGPGCYGINGADTVAYDAALLSQAVGRPKARAADARRRDGMGELRRRAGSDQRAAIDRTRTIVAESRRGRRRGAVALVQARQETW